MNKVSKFRQVV